MMLLYEASACAFEVGLMVLWRPCCAVARSGLQWYAQLAVVPSTVPGCTLSQGTIFFALRVHARQASFQAL